MDLDLAQVRAFTAAADLLHFGRAADRLGISQQALSKRIARLEEVLGARLLDRSGGRGVRLTETGGRFLGPARRALAAGERAVAAATGGGSLRIDVWGHLYAPMRSLAPVLDGAGLPAVEPGAARDYPAVVRALRRGETDLGLGRVPATAAPEGLAHRTVRLEPVDAVLGADHPLADAAQLRPADLRDSLLHHPAEPGRLDFLTAFADRFGVSRRTGGPNLGLAPFLAGIRDDPRAFSLFPADAVTRDHPGLRFVPLVGPTPLYAWSLLWTGPEEPPGFRPLLDAFARTARRLRWLEYDPARDWLPGSGR
ncbi:LysR family transcriptional regulator [Kitasatospora sp. NPDC051914]|uniref:LysR family transcriptional regulator n=1 Tax=Kitasatospora sp. NPDC051914 TaxID=3154945 RepID=UPI00342C4668